MLQATRGRGRGRGLIPRRLHPRGDQKHRPHLDPNPKRGWDDDDIRSVDSGIGKTASVEGLQANCACCNARSEHAKVEDELKRFKNLLQRERNEHEEELRAEKESSKNSLQQQKIAHEQELKVEKEKNDRLSQMYKVLAETHAAKMKEFENFESKIQIIKNIFEGNDCGENEKTEISRNDENQFVNPHMIVIRNIIVSDYNFLSKLKNHLNLKTLNTGKQTVSLNIRICYH